MEGSRLRLEAGPALGVAAVLLRRTTFFLLSRLASAVPVPLSSP
jgi:hypothetical protein